jgi:hypothetical protein
LTKVFHSISPAGEFHYIHPFGARILLFQRSVCRFLLIPKAYEILEIYCNKKMGHFLRISVNPHRLTLFEKTARLAQSNADESLPS